MQGSSCDSLVRGKPCSLPSPTPSTECTAGQHKCTGDNFYSCYYNHWVPDGTCNGRGCESDTKCNPPAPCTHGESRCVGSNTKEVCTYGAWARSDCPHGCEEGECKPAPPLIPWIPVEPVGPEYVVGPSPAPITATQPLQIDPYRDYCAGLTGQGLADCRAADQAEAAMMAGMFGVPSALGLAGAAAITAPTWVPATLAAGGTAYAVAQPYLVSGARVASGMLAIGGTAQIASGMAGGIVYSGEQSGSITPEQAQRVYQNLSPIYGGGQYLGGGGAALATVVQGIYGAGELLTSVSQTAREAYQLQQLRMQTVSAAEAINQQQVLQQQVSQERFGEGALIRSGPSGATPRGENIYYNEEGTQMLVIDVNQDRALQAYLREGNQWIGTERQMTSLNVSRVTLGNQFVNQTINYSGEAQAAIYQRGGGTAYLGEFAACRTGVCREKAALLHVLLAQVQKESQMTVGDITGGRHAWVELIDTVTGAIYVADPTNGFVLPVQEAYNRYGFVSNVEHMQLVRP